MSSSTHNTATIQSVSRPVGQSRSRSEVFFHPSSFILPPSAWLCVVIAAAGAALLATGAAFAADSDAASAEAAIGIDAPKTVFDYFWAGGKLMWAILACSIVAAAFAIERSLGLQRANVVDDAAHSEIMRLVGDDGPESALALARDNDTPMGRVLSSLLVCADSPRAEMESVIEDAGARELWELQRNARPLGIISNVAPLLGLLGTVIGIIRAFSDVATQDSAIGNPKMLATGIYEALITTAAGLLVAIPAYLLYHFFRGKADVLVRDIEVKALALIAALFEARREGRGPKTAHAAAKEAGNEGA